MGYSLLPRLRAASGVAEQRRLLAHEARLVSAIPVLGGAFVCVITPPVERYLLAGKYHLAASLIVAAIVAGVIKILNAFGKASVSALATPRELALVNYLGWASVLLAIAAGLAGGPWGLVVASSRASPSDGCYAPPAFYVTTRHLRLSVTVPAPTP